MRNRSRIVRVPVDYTLSVEEMIAVGQYDEVGSDIAGIFSSVVPRISGEIDIHLLFYPSPPLMTNGDLNRDLANRTLRAAETPEILALGARFQNLQREFPMVAFGSVGRGFNGGHAKYPLLDTFNGKRRFTYLWDDPYQTWSNEEGAVLAVAI